MRSVDPRYLPRLIAWSVLMGAVSPLACCATNLVNTATAAVPAGVTDPNPANNSATDTDSVAAIVSSAPIPTLSEWALLTLGLFLMILALHLFRVETRTAEVWRAGHRRSRRLR